MHKLASADAVVVSHGNSGRTWLRVLLSHFFRVKYALKEFSVIDYDNLHDRNPAIPTILFMHDNYLRDYTDKSDFKMDYNGKKLILLVRDPVDVAVSQYYQWRHRMRESKELVNPYPRKQAHDLFEFVLHPECGLPKIVAFMNGWAKALPDLAEALVIRYEDLRAHTELTLGSLLATLGQSAQPEELKDAVEFASIVRMRELEDQGIALISMPPLLRPWTRRADGYKARRGKVGGYQDIFDSGTGGLGRRLRHFRALAGLRVSPRDASRAARLSPVARAARPRVATPVPRRTFGVALRVERDQGGEPRGDDRQLVLHLPGRPSTIDLRFRSDQSVVEKVEVAPGSTGTTGAAVGSGERLHQKRVRAVCHSPLFQRLRQLNDVLAVGDRRTIRRGVQVRMAWRRWLLCAGDTGCSNREGQDR